MTLPPLTSLAAGQLGAVVLFGTAGLALLLPRPFGRNVAVGAFLTVSAAAFAAAFAYDRFGLPGANVVEAALFTLFAAGALVAGTVLVAQKNPARGAIAFAFVILSSCGLFLLLAAPFLMAATVIIYAGAIIVTFLFVLMLSHAGGPSDENDRSREPLLGSLAGFAFTGLILLTLYVSGPAPAAADEPKPAPPLLPAPVLTPADKAALVAAAADLNDAAAATDPKVIEAHTRAARARLDPVVGTVAGDARYAGAVQTRLRFNDTDARLAAVAAEADMVRDRAKAATDRLENALLDPKPNYDAVRADLGALRGDVVRLAGRGDLPARNVAAIGYALYSEHLVAVEMAGTLLLVATIGAVAIARRKGAVA